MVADELSDTQNVVPRAACYIAGLQITSVDDMAPAFGLIVGTHLEPAWSLQLTSNIPERALEVCSATDSWCSWILLGVH